MQKWRNWPVIRDVLELRENLRLQHAQRAPVLAVNQVLFPGGTLWCHLSREVYGHLLETIHRDGRPIAVCLDRFVNGLPMMDFEPYGVLATVTEVRLDGEQIAVRLQGHQRFRIVERLRSHGILYARGYAQVDPADPLEEGMEPVADMLRLMLDSEGNLDEESTARLFADAGQISCRLAERLPLANAIKLKLLELDDPHARLAIMAQFLKRERLIADVTAPRTTLADK